MNIYQRLNEIKKEVDYIRKDKRVESYMAVTHDAVTAETRPFFIKHGVMIVPRELESAFKDTGAVSAKGTPSMRFEAKYRIDFVNIDEPTEVASVEFSSHALDFGDKAPGKAHSYAMKYAILKVLQIETGESEEGREVEAKSYGKKTKDAERFAADVSKQKSVPKQAFDSLPPDEQEFLRQEAINISGAETIHAAYEAYTKAKVGMDADEQTALWGLLDSGLRSKIKAHGKSLEIAAQG